MIEKRPDLLWEFVGTAQTVGMLAGQQAQYEDTPSRNPDSG
jgi:hypothetical protein